MAGKLDVTNKTRLQYEWAAGHIRSGIGAVRVDRLERDDVARWLARLANGGELSRRSIQVIRMVVRAALDDAVATGELHRNPAASVGMPRPVAKPTRRREAEAWTGDEVRRFLDAIEGHRWESA